MSLSGILKGCIFNYIPIPLILGVNHKEESVFHLVLFLWNLYILTPDRIYAKLKVFDGWRV